MRVLPGQLRRLADEARAGLCPPLRGRVRRAVVSGGAERPAARIRRRGALDLFSVADRAAHRHAGRTLAMVFPLIRRRRLLVDVREAASNVLAGHVADSIANAEAVRAFAREPEEARIHADNVGRLRRQDAAILGLPEPARRPGDVADVRADEHPRAHRRAVGRERRHGREPGGGLHHVQLLRDRDARDVGVQPHLPESRRRADGCGAVRGAAARAAGVVDVETADVLHAGPISASSCATSVSGIRPRSRCCSIGCRSGSRLAPRSGWSDAPAAERRR